MVAGPALLLAGFATHPAEGDNPEETLRTISDHGREWAVSHLLLFAAAAVLIPAVLGLARVVGGRHRRNASIAAGLVVFAMVGLGGAAVAEQLLGVAATLDGDRAAMVRLAEAAESTPAFLSMAVLPQVAVVLGFLTMAWALLRSKAVPAWAAAAMAVATIGVVAPEPGRCIGSALLLATFVTAVRRSHRAEAAAPARSASRLTVAAG